MARSSNTGWAYVTRYYDRHGKTRFRFRKGTFSKSMPSPNDPLFKSIYGAALVLADKGIAERPVKASKYSLEWASILYTSSNEFKETNNPKSQRTKHNLIKRMNEAWGDTDVRQLTRATVIEQLEQVKSPTVRNRIRGIYNKIFEILLDKRVVAENFIPSIKRSKENTKHTPHWTMADRLQYEAAYPTGTRERLAYALLLYTVQRSSDVVSMGPHSVIDGMICGVQVKTGTAFHVPISPELAKELKHWTGETYLMTSEDDPKPFKAKGFQQWFSAKREQAGLGDECTGHGLRVTGCEELAETGCTAHELMAISGHITLSEAQKYVAKANKKKMAKEAGRKRSLTHLKGDVSNLPIKRE